MKSRVGGGMTGVKRQREMNPQSMVERAVDHLELDVEPGSIGFERQGEPDRQRRLEPRAGTAVLAEPAVDRVSVAGREPGTQRPGFRDRMRETAHPVRRLRIALR